MYRIGGAIAGGGSDRPGIGGVVIGLMTCLSLDGNAAAEPTVALALVAA